MKEINEEIRLTLNLMRADIDIDDGARDELQGHLYSLLEMKREILYRDHPDSFDHANGTGKAKPLTAEELKAGGWWCADVSKDCVTAFESKHLRVFNSSEWEDDLEWIGRFWRKQTNPLHRK